MFPQSSLSSQPLMILAPWVILHIGWHIPLILPWVTASYFLVGNRKAELKPTPFVITSTFLCFPIFPLLLTPQQYSTFECCLLGLLLHNNISYVLLFPKFLTPNTPSPIYYLSPLNPCTLQPYFIEYNMMILRSHLIPFTAYTPYT